MLSTFTTTVRTEVELPPGTDAEKKARAAWEAGQAPLVAALKKFEAEQLPERLAAWEKTGAKPAGAPAAAVQALAVPRDKRTKEQTAALVAWYRGTDAEWRKLNQQV